MSQEILLEWDEVILSSVSPLPQARSAQGHQELILLFPFQKSKIGMKSCVAVYRGQFV